MYNHNKAQQSKNRVHISWDILYLLQGPWIEKTAVTQEYVQLHTLNKNVIWVVSGPSTSTLIEVNYLADAAW